MLDGEQRSKTDIKMIFPPFLAGSSLRMIEEYKDSLALPILKQFRINDCLINRFFKSNNQWNDDDNLYHSPLIIQLIRSEDPVAIIMIIEYEIVNNDFKMSKEAESIHLISFLLDLIASNQDKIEVICHIIPVIIHILKNARKNILSFDFLSNVRDSIIDIATWYINQELTAYPYFQSQIIELCSLYINDSESFRVFLISDKKIISEFNNILLSNEILFDYSRIIKFMKIIIQCESNDDCSNIINSIANLITSVDYYYRFKAIKFINFAIDKMFIKEQSYENLIEKVKQAFIIDDLDDIYTFDVICNFFCKIIERYSPEIFINDEHISNILFSMGKISYIPGKFNSVDNIIEYCISIFPGFMIDNDFLSYLMIENDISVVKHTKLFLLSKLFENEEISIIVSENLPPLQFNFICQMLLERKEFNFCIIDIVIKIMEVNLSIDYIKNSCVDAVLNEICDSEELTEEEREKFSIIRNKISAL